MRLKLLNKILTAKHSGRLSLIEMDISDEEILSIMSKIQENKINLVSIDLDKNQIGDEGATILSEHLIRFQNLTEISIQSNRIGKDGAIKLFGLKNMFPDLDILFHGNQITNVSEMEEIKKTASAWTGGMQRRF
jgi:hypothetical protein